MSKTLSLRPAFHGGFLRHSAATALRSASAMLARMARRLRVARADGAPRVPVIEFQAFHRDAGAPEGALFVDGEFVGFVAGITRL